MTKEMETKVPIESPDEIYPAPSHSSSIIPLGYEKKAMWRHKRQRKSLNFSLNMLRCSQQAETVDFSMTTKRSHEETPPSTSSTGGSSGRKSETPVKRVRKDESPEDLSVSLRRSQPHRAARYMESYSNIAGAEESTILSDDDQRNGAKSSSEAEDSDIEIIPKSPIAPLTDEEQLAWENKVQTLQQNLRNEEIKLVLLKKLKESQSKKEEKKEEVNTSVPSHVKMTHKSPRSQLQITNISASQSPMKQLMPIKKNIQQVQPQDLTKTVKSGQSSSPNNVVTLHAENLSKSSISIVPVNSKASNSSPKPPAPIKNEVSISLVPTPKSASPAQQTKVDKELTSQQQAVAKMALRKQLEKTLLQIPTPRPKVQKLHFLPNSNSTEFIWLLGLDIVVDFITSTKPLYVGPKEPYTCYQCKSNFSESWNTLEESSKRKKIICQSCYASNTKKSLKVEHTGYLKAAFVKALQQEKEIERLSQSFSLSSPSVMPTPSVVSTASAAQSISSQPVFNNKSVSSRTATASPNMFLGNNNLFMQQFGKLTPQQLQAIFQAQAQSFMSANIPLPAHMVPFSPFIAQYPFHLMNKSGSNQNDLQRQYLLDMIPSRTSSCAPVKRKR